MELWENELTEQERDGLIEQIAEAIEKRHLTTPAILFLAMHKPLAGVGAQATVAFAPFLGPFVGFELLNNYSRLMKDSANIELLLRRLESAPAPASTGSVAPTTSN